MADGISRKKVEEIISTTQQTTTQKVAKELLLGLHSWITLQKSMYPNLSLNEFADKMQEHIRSIGKQKKYNVWRDLENEE